MDERVTADAIKPNYDQVRKAWAKLLEPYYLPDGALRPENLVAVACPFCGTSSHRGDFVLNGFRHVTCVECASVYVTPRLKDECLARLYNDEYYNAAYTGSMIPAFEVRRRLIGQRKFAQIRDLGGAGDRVLDIGCGVGEVIDVFKGEGWRCDAIEVNPSAVAWLKTRGISVFEGPFDSYPESERFSVIMAWGVVEHVVNPKQFLRKVYRHLLPGGLFVSEVPNGQSLLVDYARATARDPGRILLGEQHIMLYSTSAYQKLHLECGFAGVHLQTNGLDVETLLKMENESLSDPVIAALQACVDGYLKGDLIRGFWRRPATTRLA